MLELDLPWPPTVNHYYTVVRGRKILSANGREYAEKVAREVLVQRGAKLLKKRLGVCIYAFPPDKRKRDLSNIIKALEDALTHAGVWLDDGQIDDLRIKRGCPAPAGSVRVEVREMS